MPAARGFLIMLALKAAEAVKMKIKVWAVESNPNAAVSLHLQHGLCPKVKIIDGTNCDDATIDTKGVASFLTEKYVLCFGSTASFIDLQF